MEHLFEFIIPADHPALAGHFPGRPIVPAVVILAKILTFVEQVDTLSAPWKIKNTKFLSILEPGARALVEIEAGSETLRFTCRSGSAVIAKGILTRLPSESQS